MTVKIIEDEKWTRWDDIKMSIGYSFPVKHIRDLYHYIRHSIIHKHHLINTRLPKGHWYDTDHRLLYGMMNLLAEYLVKEKPMELIDWDSDELHEHARDEMLDIARWWRNYENRLKEIEEAIDVWHDCKFKNVDDDLTGWVDEMNKPDTPQEAQLLDLTSRLENILIEEEEDMLIRLIKIRKFLWT